MEGLAFRALTPEDCQLTAVGRQLTAEHGRTRPDGYCAFADLDPDTYYLEFTAPAGYVFTSPHQGDDFNDSDADPVSGETPPIVFANDDLLLNWDAGLDVDRQDAPNSTDTAFVGRHLTRHSPTRRLSTDKRLQISPTRRLSADI